MTAAARGATVAIVSPGDGNAAEEPADDRVGLLGRLRLDSDPRRDAALTLAVAALVALSRWLGFPASIWDIDEAIFANALVDFDPAGNYPHPPFFPLWVGLGSGLLRLLPGLDPTLALRLLSAALSVWMLWPLAALWSHLMPRVQAVLAALLFMLMPVPWLLAGRAYTETAATAFLVGAAALWLEPNPSRRRTLAGALLLTASILTRPQWVLVAVPFILWRAVSSRGWVDRLLPLLLPPALCLPVALHLASAIGGLPELLRVVGRHGSFHFGSLAQVSTGLLDLSILQGCGNAAWGALWLFLAAEGAAVLALRRETRRAAVVLVAALLLPTLLLITLGQNPTALRYTVPYFALTSGLVVAAVAGTLPRPALTPGLVVPVLALLVSLSVPHLREYREVPSPAVRALEDPALTRTEETVELIADRSLASFVELWRNLGRLRARVTWDYQVQDQVVVSEGASLVAVFDRSRLGWTVRGSRTTHYRCHDPWLRRFVNPRLLDLEVVEGLTPAAPPEPAAPGGSPPPPGSAPGATP